MMKVKRGYAITLAYVLANANVFFKDPISSRFRYMVSHNLKIAGEELRQVNEAFPDEPSYREYEARRLAIMRELGFTNNAALRAATPEQREILDRKILDLREECKVAVEAQALIDKNRAEFCDEEIELDLRKVRVEDIPDIEVPDGIAVFPHTQPLDSWGIWHIIEQLSIDPEAEAGNKG